MSPALDPNPPVAGLHLVLGGARSGKSAYAQSLAVAQETAGREVCVVATALGADEEMRARIARHRADRPSHWRLVEPPPARHALARAIDAHAGPRLCLLVDCLTLWLSNLMLAERDPEVEARRLTRFLGVARYPVVLVSNEVGLGLVPETPLGRSFRDAQGRLNQIVAATVPNVVFIAAGLPLWLKRSS